MAEITAHEQDAPGWIEVEQEGDLLRVVAGGRWTIDDAMTLDPLTRDRDFPGVRRVQADLSQIEELDTAGAWILWRWGQEFRNRGIDPEMLAENPAHTPLFDLVENSQCTAEDTVREHENPLLLLLIDMGKTTVWAWREMERSLNFVGLTIVTLLRTLPAPWTWRPKAVIAQIEQTGIRALPIVGLLSFLVGVVMAYQGAEQLARFGAEIFTVNFLGVAILREIGVLMTAIMVAGRSGSAFTASIGTMTVNEEVDAIEVLGLDQIEVLVLPRVLALMVTLPLLTFWSDVVGLLGGAVMAVYALDISPQQFVEQLKEAVTVEHFLVGMVKAPIFAIIIAMVGCEEGLRTKRNAESVGTQTTKSVVKSIFLVIVFDAGFSIMFSLIGI